MGSPGTDGNTLHKPLPPTEYVEDVAKVESVLLRGCLRNPRTWEEFLREILEKDYPGDVRHLDRAVTESSRRARQGYVPTCAMDKFRENERLNNTLALK